MDFIIKYLADLTCSKKVIHSYVEYEYEWIKIEINESLIESIKLFLLSTFNSNDTTNTKIVNNSFLLEIIDWKSDMRNKLKDFFLQDDETEIIIKHINQSSDDIKVYRFGEDFSYFPYCSVTDYIRWFVIKNDLYCLFILGYD